MNDRLPKIQPVSVLLWLINVKEYNLWVSYEYYYPEVVLF